jgi:hypothetical protein
LRTDAVPEAPRPSRAKTSRSIHGGTTVSIVRIGLAETKHFAEGYDAIFGKKKAAAKKAKPAAGKKKKAKKKA